MNIDDIELDVATVPLSDQFIELLTKNSDVPWSQNTLRSWAELKTSYIYVALINEQIVAAILWQVVSNSAEIANIVVDKKYRRQGVATLLLQASIAALRHKEVRNLCLEVRASNENAQKLYKNVGFKMAATRPAYYQSTHERPNEDAYVYRLDI